MNSNLSLESFRTYTFLHVILFLYSFGSVFSKLASRLSFGTFEFFIYYGMVIFILGIYDWNNLIFIIKQENWVYAFYIYLFGRELLGLL